MTINEYNCATDDHEPVPIRCFSCGKQFCEYCCGKVRHEQLNGDLGPWMYICSYCYQERPGSYPDVVEAKYDRK